MANRYTLNLRDLYDANDVPLGTRLGRGVGLGISNAITRALTEGDRRREERNQMAVAGARAAGKGTAPPDESQLPHVDASVGAAIDRQIQTPDQIGRQQMQALLPGGASSGGLGDGAGDYRTAPVMPPFARTDAPSGPAGQMPGPGNPTIASAIAGLLPSGQSITLEGRGGQRYVFDPQESARRKFQLEQQEKAIESATQQGVDEQERQRKAGILRPRYGPDADLYANFPDLNPDRFRPYTGLTYDQRAALEGIKGGQREQLQDERLTAQRELQRLRNTGQIAAIQQRRAQALGDAGAERKAIQVQINAVKQQAKLAQRYSAIDRSMVGDDPAAQQAIANSDAELENLRGRLDDLYGRLAEMGDAGEEISNAAPSANTGVVIRGGGAASTSPASQQGAPSPADRRAPYDGSGGGLMDSRQRAQARAMALKLKAEGRSRDEIIRALQAAGYRVQ